MNAKATWMPENTAKAILFAILLIFVLIFIGKFSKILLPVPVWTRSLNSVEKTIDTLDPRNTELVRTVNVQLEKYIIKGFGESDDMCPEDKEKPHCICACSSEDCSNADKSPTKFCRSISYFPSNFVLPKTEDPLTYEIGLDKVNDVVVVKVLGIAN